MVYSCMVPFSTEDKKDKKEEKEIRTPAGALEEPAH